MPFQSASLWVGFILGLSPLGDKDGPWQYQLHILQLNKPSGVGVPFLEVPMRDPWADAPGPRRNRMPKPEPIHTVLMAQLFPDQ